MTYNDAVEEALCFGWIDGVVNAVDDIYYRQLFTPRKPKSVWARSNKARVARLIDAGLMTDAGLAAIERAKANGSWDALTAAESLVVPPELQMALDRDGTARKNWSLFTDSQRKQLLSWLAAAKRPETRARRVSEIVSMSSRRMMPGQTVRPRRKV